TAGRVRAAPATTATGMMREIPGGQPFYLWPEVGKALKGIPEAGTTWKPTGWRIRGMAGAAESTMPLAKTHELIAWYTEAMNRGAPFLHQLKRGMHPAEASVRVALAQVDYASKSFTPTEREILRRVFPFYSFSSRQMSYLIRQLWEHPGGRLAQAIRTGTRLRDPSVVLPPHIGQTAAVPVPPGTPVIGPHPGGVPRYITGFGFMEDDPLQLMGPGAGLEMLSRMHPLIKWPLESITGQSFFQRGPLGGREITEMDPPLGRLLANLRGDDEPVQIPRWIENMLTNMPTSRFVSMARTLTDPRKRWGPGAKMPGAAALIPLLTGVRMADVEISVQERMLKDIINKLIQETPGARAFTQFYFPQPVLERMEPEEREKAEELTTASRLLQRRIRERAKQRELRRLPY
ncbi:MAG: hypothetical protein FD153_1640, partial [Rhodospirillaceae bacterium]